MPIIARHSTRVLGTVASPPHLAQFILTSLALFCWLPLHSGSQRYTCKQQEDFRLYSYPHMSTDLCLYVKRLSIWATTCFLCRGFCNSASWERAVPETSGALHHLYYCFLPCVTSAEKAAMCPALWAQRSEPSKVLRKLISGIPNSRHQLEARPGYQDSEEGCGFYWLRASHHTMLAGVKVHYWPIGLGNPVHHNSYFTVFSFGFFCFFCSSYSSIFFWK